jgi:hypothetical protein
MSLSERSMARLLVEHVRRSDDREAEQRRDDRDRGDSLRLPELAELAVGRSGMSSSCSKTQRHHRSNQTPTEGCGTEKSKPCTLVASDQGLLLGGMVSLDRASTPW